MRTAQQAVYRPRVQNQMSTNRRAQTAAKQPASRLRVLPQQAVAPRPRRRTVAKKQTAPLPNGLSVMGLLLAASAALGLMFIVALGWQRNAHGLAQQEVGLRSVLDQVSDERQQLMVENRRALNPRETSARSENDGLKDIKLDQRSAGSPQKPAPTNTIPKVVTKMLNEVAPLKAAAEKAAASIAAKDNNTKSTPTTR